VCSMLCLISCGTFSTTGFTSAISCGANGPLTYCGTCSAPMGYPSNGTGTAQQRCH
jgi:hypothetical protein